MSIFRLLIKACLVSCFGLNVYCAHLPPDLKACSRSDPNFNECVRASVENALRTLANGNKPLGLAALEPLHIDSISVGRIPTSRVNIDQKFRNIKLHGLSKSKINKVEVNPQDYSIQVDVFAPELRTEADFEIKGQLLVFPINGRGPCNITMTNLTSHHNLTGEIFQKKGKDYYRLTDYKITLKPEKIVYKFHNVLGNDGNSRLSEDIDKVLNENSLSIFEEIRPATEESYGLIFKQIANKLFTKIPLNEIYKV